MRIDDKGGSGKKGMTGYKYKVGSRVALSPKVPRAANGPYEVVRLLPVDGEVRQYRIKSEKEPNERVAKEYQLRPFQM